MRSLLLLVLLSAGLAAAEELPSRPDLWEKQWQTMEQRDRRAPPQPGTIAGIGSSSMAMWRLRESFPDLPVWNRAFGGSTTGDVVLAAPRLLTPNRPRVVLYYCGDNDLAAPDATAERPVAGFRAFVATLRADLPRVRIIYLSIKPSPRRAAMWPMAQRANELIRAWCADDPLLAYVDVATPMLAADGTARAELFLGDQLHMNAAGYALWRDTVAPVLTRMWAEAQAEAP